MASSSPKSVDRSRLYTDLMYRFQYVSSFMDFGAQDIAAIRASAKIVAPLVPVVVDAVYKKLFSFDITRNMFMAPMNGFTGNLVRSPDELATSEQIQFRKDMLSKYLERLVTAEYDEKLVRFLDKIAAFHTRNKTRQNAPTIDYVHIGALMGFVSSILLRAIADSKAFPANDDKKTTLVAFNKLLWIQNDLFAQYYTYDGLEIPNSLANTREVAIPQLNARAWDHTPKKG